MAKVQKVIKKNINKKQNKKEMDPLKKQVITGVFIIVVLGLLMGIILFKDYLDKKKLSNKEPNFSEILATQTFNKGSNQYYVIFYDINIDTSLTTTLEEINPDTNLYVVDLSNKFNEDIISDNSNKTPTKYEELKINGPTLLIINDNLLVAYIEGIEEIESYLKEL